VSARTQQRPLPGAVRGICEITLETGDLAGLERFYRNVVEVWDFFEHGEGARDGVRALA